MVQNKKIILLPILANFQNKPGSADVLRSMEMFALQAAMRLPREDMAEPLITNNISESMHEHVALAPVQFIF